MSVVKSNPEAETVGVSPKVAWPAVVLFVVGAVLVVLHFVLDEDGDTLLSLGLAAIGASGVTGGIGFAAPAALQKSKTGLTEIKKPGSVTAAETGTTYARSRRKKS